MLSAIQIHDPMPLRESVPERLGDFLRLPDMLEVNLQVATLVEGVATPHATPPYERVVSIDFLSDGVVV
jgi:hypothetical protein